MVKAKLGKKVPDFSVTATNEAEFNLSQNIGKNMVSDKDN